MPSSEELFDDLLKETLSYINQTHRGDEKIFFINPSPKQMTICASEATPNREGAALVLNEEHHCREARATRKIDLAKPQQADCHLFGARVNNPGAPIEVAPPPLPKVTQTPPPAIPKKISAPIPILPPLKEEREEPKLPPPPQKPIAKLPSASKEAAAPAEKFPLEKCSEVRTFLSTDAANPSHGVGEAGGQKSAPSESFLQGKFLVGAAAKEALSLEKGEPANLEKIFLDLAPHLLSQDPIPDDAGAEKKRCAWKEKRLAAEVTILSFKSHTLEHSFLQNLATAIDIRLRPSGVALATLLEKENHWDSFFESSALKHIISFPIPFDHFPHLLRYYKENPRTEQKFLHTTPLTLLLPFSEYQLNPLLKKELWTRLCTQLSS